MKEGNWKAFNASSLGASRLLSLRVYKLIYPYLTTYQIEQLIKRLLHYKLFQEYNNIEYNLDNLCIQSA